ncbi:MAG TPA: toxin-antitoxin system YwqK family antitoxin [Cyclobacteriaceae bacterium]|jgi:antitoxin component YwqK of YwqJK toxin-antitoxin module|nr:toxin-antitoxin system YwqK family antitoxin [Cyclobacteriaceae bacterium]HRK53950.1 toxin-antitoxin system YwqK family antitoxin [Cyclobacteriaceae bacterium]
MKLFFLFFSAVLISCSLSDSEGTYPGASTGEGIPVGAIQERFEDTPSLAGVRLNDGAGNISQSGVIEDGKRVGNWVEYHPNGIVKSVVSYVDGKKEGLALEISNNGQLEKRMQYHNDQLHGDYREFRYSTVKEERNYQNGKLEGIVKIYYDNGKIMEEGAYQNGIRHGLSKWYDQEGNLTIEYEYRNGELIKK